MPLLLDPGKEVVRDCREVKASLLRTLRIVDELGGAVLFGHEFVAKLEHVRAPFFAKIIFGVAGRQLSLQTNEPTGRRDESSAWHPRAPPASLQQLAMPTCPAPEMPIALGSGVRDHRRQVGRQMARQGPYGSPCGSELGFSPLTRAHIPKKRGHRAPRPQKPRPTARWSSHDREPTAPARCFSDLPCPANWAKRQ